MVFPSQPKDTMKHISTKSQLFGGIKRRVKSVEVEAYDLPVKLMSPAAGDFMEWWSRYGAKDALSDARSKRTLQAALVAICLVDDDDKRITLTDSEVEQWASQIGTADMQALFEVADSLCGASEKSLGAAQGN